MWKLELLAPSIDRTTEYDRRHLALYTALLDAAELGIDWQDAAASVMQLDVAHADAQACWKSHLDRARWIVGEGLGNAIAAFNVRPNQP